MKDVTIKNTKDVIYDAYTEVLDKIKELQNTKIDPQKQVAEKAKKEVIKKAEEVIGLDILNSEIVAKYDSVKEAIEIGKEELDNIYAIKVEAETLTALVNANIDKKLQLEKEDREEEEAYDKKNAEREVKHRELVSKLEENYASQTKELRKKYTEDELALKQERARNEEVYKYDLLRARKLENDKWADEKEQREKVLAEREAKVSEREAKIQELEDLIDELNAKVEEHPVLIEKAKKEGEESKAKDLATSYAIQKASITKDAEWEQKILQQQLDSVTKEVDKANAKVVELEEKLNDAYAQVKDIATTTVKSQSGVRIIESNPSKNEK